VVAVHNVMLVTESASHLISLPVRNQCVTNNRRVSFKDSFGFGKVIYDIIMMEQEK
jgi:hypothetical protein